MKTLVEILLKSALPALAFMIILSSGADAQLLKKGDYGVGVTVAVYQFDDTRSKAFAEVNKLNQTASTPEEEMDVISRSFGAEEVKFRYVRSVGLRESESFTDSQPMNEQQFTYTITPRVVTKNDVSFEFSAKYADKVLLDLKGVTVGSYETVMLRGARSGFGVREFKGPEGVERAPETRALLITITPTVTTSRSLQNKPSDISRPTDQFGSRVTLSESDIFVMPAVINRSPVKFPPGSQVKGSITLEGVVTPEGRITNVRVLDTPDTALNPKAIEAFRQYRFNPAKLNGRATYATFRETIILSKQGPL
ncbi:MAG TPA: TonB family protein [Blastocatellia bacterium]|nr:TonB family protein [Blastocatellia bacterium]